MCLQGDIEANAEPNDRKVSTANTLNSFNAQSSVFLQLENTVLPTDNRGTLHKEPCSTTWATFI